LVGGSALALRISHRISEDLDIVFVRDSLPKTLPSVVRKASAHGIELLPKDDPAAIEEFISGGLELRDYQQDFVANGRVRLSLFVADDPLSRILRQPLSTHVRIASLQELFKAKALVSARRSKSRDWLDLYLLLKDHGFSLADYRQAFREAGIETQYEIGLARLCSGVPQRDDEGFSGLLKNPPTVEEMKSFFQELRDQLEIEEAAKRRRPSGK